jgi:hypothetical protein
MDDVKLRKVKDSANVIVYRSLLLLRLILYWPIYLLKLKEKTREEKEKQEKKSNA